MYFTIPSIMLILTELACYLSASLGVEHRIETHFMFRVIYLSTLIPAAFKITSGDYVDSFVPTLRRIDFDKLTRKEKFRALVVWVILTMGVRVMVFLSTWNNPGDVITPYEEFPMWMKYVAHISFAIWIFCMARIPFYATSFEIEGTLERKYRRGRE